MSNLNTTFRPTWLGPKKLTILPFVFLFILAILLGGLVFLIVDLA